MSFPRYPNYKPSGVEWLGEVPEHWEIKRLKHLIRTVEQGWSPQCEGFPVEAETEWGVLKVGCVNGGIFNPLENKALPVDLVPIPELTLESGDLLISRANTRELVGSAAVVMDSKPRLMLCDKLYRLRTKPTLCSPQFLSYYLSSPIVRGQIELCASGASSSMLNISQSVILELPLAISLLNEQNIITAFLDQETAKIDALVAEQQRLIELLKEKRQAVISHAVTKGLDPTVPMKPSGIEWLGDIPAHWMKIRLRNLFRQEKRQDHLEREVLSVYRDYGVIPKSSRDDNMNKTPDDLSLYQLVNPGDLVINKMKAWQGSLGISRFEGITSPDYVVFSSKNPECASFLHLLLRSRPMVSVYLGISNGIRPSQWRLEPDLFLSLYVFMPPLQEQKDIASFIEREILEFETLTAEAERAIELLQERRTALISAAVTGQIDVRQLAQGVAA